MKLQLNQIEARIIGALIEKAITTPDYYPLSLNSLMTACNQKSNREPVLSLNESEVGAAVNRLIDKNIVTLEGGFNARTSKYAHRFCNTTFGDLQLTDKEIAVVCCLLLRGPQTPGEIKTRTNRLAQFGDVKEVEATLESLMSNTFGIMVEKLEKEPGKREARYRQLFTEADNPITVHHVLQTSNATASVALSRDEVVKHIEFHSKELERYQALLKDINEEL
ncbi:YceH family protein [Vibrio sp.]|nr:YceH family protein [Vibrio sp.]